MTIPLNAFDREEHDGDVNAKNVSVVKSTATLYAVVNTGAAGVGQSLVTVLNPVSIAGNVTVDSGNIALTSAPTLYAVVNTAAAGIGQSLVTVLNPVSIAGNVTIDSGTVTLGAGAAYVGLATVDIGSAPTLTVDATGQGDVPITLDGETVATTFSGNVTIDSGTVSVDSNTAWSDPNTYIGLATVDIGSAPTLVVDATGQGDVPVTLDGETVDVSDRAARDLGKVDVAAFDVALPAGDNNIGNVDIVTNTAWSNPNTYIGLATIDIGSSPTLTVDATGQGDVPVTLDSEAVVLGAGAAYAGLATIDVGKSERYSYAYTSGPTTDWAVKASAGFLHAIHVGAAVASSVIEISNDASDGDGNVVIYQAGDTIGPAVYPLNMTMDTGITLDITNQTHVTVIYK